MVAFMTRLAVPLIVLAQLFGTSLWFSANAAAASLVREWGLSTGDIGLLTNAVQLGFIAGTFGFAFSGLADRFPASRIVAACAAFGAASNAAFALLATGLADASVYRFLTGIALAGVYPLGMKLVVGWAPKRAGEVLGWLVGMLTIGTALPHFVRATGSSWPWSHVVLASSALALLGAAMVLWLGDGPHFRVSGKGAGIRFGAVRAAFRIPAFRASAFGYFGHMWELYAFWTLAPFLLAGIAARFLRPLYLLSYNKWYFDELYEATVVNGTKAFSRALGWFDNHVVDGLVNLVARVGVWVSFLAGRFDDSVVDGSVNGVANATIGSGSFFRRFQTGKIYHYVFVLAGGALILFLVKAF